MSLDNSIARIKSFDPGYAVRHMSGSIKVWLALAGFLAVTKIVLDAFFPTALADPAQAAFFQWLPLGIISLAGLIGVVLSERTGFPDVLNAPIPAWKRIGLPILVGLALSIIPVALDSMTHFQQLIAARHGLTLQYTGFVPMLLAFTAGAIIVEVIYRLVPIPLVMWLSSLVLKQKGQSLIFWTLAILTSFLEPMGMIQDLGVIPGMVMPIVTANILVVNFAQAAFFRKYGFLAAILVRAAFYLVWHAIYVH
jgi:hypothetical protein